LRKRILSFFILAILTFIISSCDSGLEVKDISISKYPERIIYIVGEDKELDLTGCEIEVTTKSGIKSIEKMDDEHFRNLYTIQEDVNYNKAGVYKINILRHKSSCSFAIQVVNKDDL
jgi:hypothetical protein